MTYSNFFPVSFGANFAIKDTSTVEQYEHVEAIAVGYGATYYLKVNQQDVESCPQEDARAANAFPRHIRKMLRNPAYNWRLEALGDGDSWVLYRLEGQEKRENYLLRRTISNR